MVIRRGAIEKRLESAATLAEALGILVKAGVVPAEPQGRKRAFPASPEGCVGLLTNLNVIRPWDVEMVLVLSRDSLLVRAPGIHKALDALVGTEFHAQLEAVLDTAAAQPPFIVKEHLEIEEGSGSIPSPAWD